MTVAGLEAQHRALDRSDAAPTAASDAFFRLFQLGILLKIGLGSQVLNLFVNYSDGTGGPLIFKIHPGSYIIIGLGLMAAPQVLRQAQIRSNPLAIGTVTLLAAPFVMAAWASFHGRSGGLGFLVDSVLTGPMAVFAIAMLSAEQRFRVCRSVVFFFAINAVIVLIEFVTHFRFTPYPYREASFRPSGLLGHPLSTGTLHTATIPALFMMPFPNLVRWSLTGLLALSVIASQARVATIVCIFVVAVMFFAHIRSEAAAGNARRATTKIGLILSLVLMAVPVAALILLSQGFFDRLLAGFNDESTQSRIVIYDIFQYMSWNQIYYGMDLDRAMYYVNKGLKIDYIESVIVIFIINFGLFAGAFFMITILVYATGLAWNAPWQAQFMTFCYMVLILSNNGLAGKGATFVFLALFCFGAGSCALPGDPGRQQRSGNELT